MVDLHRPKSPYPLPPIHPLDFSSPISSPSSSGHNRSTHLITVVMAAITNSLSRPLPLSRFCRLQQSPSLPKSSSSTFLGMPIRRIHAPPMKTRAPTIKSLPPTSAASSTAPAGAEKKAKSESEDERVQQVHNIEEFDAALQNAKNKLVVVEFAASHSYHSRKIYPFMVELSRTCGDVEFLLVMGDESEETKALCAREKIEQVPHFSFYKSMEKIHEEEGIGPDELMGDVLYYGDSHSAVEQLHSWDDVKRLVEKHKAGKKLIVLDVGLKHCGPCVKVYPTVIKLSRQMSETVVFARLNGDENDSCMEFLKEMEVVEVPTFLFIREGEVRGRYVGSGKGELIGEILRYQGVKVT